MAIASDTLHSIIYKNTAAKKLANKGDDAGVLPLIFSALPKVVVEGSFCTELGILAAFTTPEEANNCLLKLEAVAEQNAVLKRVMNWLKPGSNGLDFGNTVVRNQLDALGSAGVLTQVEVDTLKSIGERTIDVTVNDVSEAWSRYRGAE